MNIIKELQNKLKCNELEIKTYKAIIRQYEQKAHKIKKIATAGVNRHEDLLDISNNDYKQGNFDKFETKSDPEDYAKGNQISNRDHNLSD